MTETHSADAQSGDANFAGHADCAGEAKDIGNRVGDDSRGERVGDLDRAALSKAGR